MTCVSVQDVSPLPSDDEALRAAVESACRIIAPSWPLDQQIAVNPLWGMTDLPFRQVVALLRRLAGSRFVPPPDVLRAACESGRIRESHLRRALHEAPISVTVDSAIAALHTATTESPRLPLPSDLLDERAAWRGGPLWRDTITQQVSQFCAAYFDTRQADWHGDRSQSLYATWRTGLIADRALAPLMKAPDISARARGLPDSAEDAIDWALRRLRIPAADAVPLLQSCLLRINGWAAWCAWLGWQAALEGGSDDHLRQLLAIRVCWEALLLDDCRQGSALEDRWLERWQACRDAPPAGLEGLGLAWQRALEIGYQDAIVRQFEAYGRAPRMPRQAARPDAQLVFCIDVRSERFRRALEGLAANYETRGFAGFFGLPLRYRPHDSGESRAQLPGLLRPSLEVTDSTGDPGKDAALTARQAARHATRESFRPFLKSPSGGFALVETVGLGFAAGLLRRHLGWTGSARNPGTRPHLVMADRDTITSMADQLATILRAMSLTQGFGRLLVLVGHGSESANNPQAAALDCGACGGHSGDVNARVLAQLLNDPALRAALGERGIALPADTVAVAALHNTTTDEVTLFDCEAVPDSHRTALQDLRAALAAAGSSVRAERAADLGLAELQARPAALLDRLQRRARDWAETRPEWGLANNGALVVAPRSRTQGVDLGGRAFLHDYEPVLDEGGEVLEAIMTAPLVVAHWINLQYYASTVDPERFGSGNKLLHNVAGGRIGVFEGNTGDLRIGLSRQSLHDGSRWMHEPLRLSVFIDAPQTRIEQILHRHDSVRQLVDNEWLYLFRFGDDCIEWRRHGKWERWNPEPQSP